MRNTRKNSNQGFLSQIASAVGLGNSSANSTNTATAPAAVNVALVENKTTKLQQGGMAPVNFRYPANMQQPSERVMQWATTADAPIPPASEMRNVAHGGKRHTKKRKTAHKRRSSRKTRSCGGKRRTHRRHHRHHKRRN